jgi:hypothetical protein
MADQFGTAHERGDDDVPRDRWGRYLLPHPETGKKTAWTRSTTFAKSISDTFALSQWSQRMVAKGLTTRRDLLAMATTLDVKADKDKLNQICEDAKAAAGNKVAANLGTALHSFSEAVDRGDMAVADVPEPHRDDIAAYAATMRNAGLTVVPDMIERQTVLPAFEVGGTFDRILSLDGAERWFLEALDADVLPGHSHHGTEVIGDVKSGQDLQYGWNEIAIQLLIYALGARTAGVWNRATQSWEPPRPVRVDFAIVMHVPVDQKTATLYKLDLTDAMDALDLCRSVRRWRKLRVLATPLERAVVDTVTSDACGCGGYDPGGHVDGCPNDTGAGHEHLPTDAVGVRVEGLSWLERFQLAGSRGELSALFTAANEAGVWSDTLKDAGMARLRVLEEKAG